MRCSKVCVSLKRLYIGQIFSTASIHSLTVWASSGVRTLAFCLSDLKMSCGPCAYALLRLNESKPSAVILDILFIRVSLMDNTCCLFSSYIRIGCDVGSVVAVVLPEVGINLTLCLRNGETIVFEVDVLLAVLWIVLG